MREKSMITNTLIFFSLVISLSLSPLSPVPEQVERNIALIEIQEAREALEQAEIRLDTNEARLNRAWSDYEKTGIYVDELNRINEKREEIRDAKEALEILRRELER